VSLKISQIIIGVPENASYKELLEIKKLAGEISERAQRGESFKDLAEFYSEQKVKVENRGSLGSYTAQQLVEVMPEEHVRTIFSLSSGQVSPPLWSSDIYSVVRVDERSDEKVLTFEQARENIKSFLLRMKGEELFRDWLVARRNASRVHYMIDME
jgi:parvulin-like peptidyl-prolyl isomerase